MQSLVTLSLALLLLGCGEEPRPASTPPPAAASQPEATELATLAGGCFWCIEAPFEKIPGVLSAISGYTGGHVPNPTYREVSSGRTGHAEAVQITFDPSRTSYAELLDHFWQLFDPTDAGGSFADRGSQYRSAIFTHSDQQRRIAEASRAALGASGRFDLAIVTEITPLEVFYPAEDDHQNYYEKNP